MSTFYETAHFIVESRPKLFVSRTDGGHIRIRIIEKIATKKDIQKMHGDYPLESLYETNNY